ncbi:MAG: nitroreductase [Hyphomicrobium sp.]
MLSQDTTMSRDVLTFLARRRSVKPDKLSGPGPTADELTEILTVGARVPDHKKLTPWRFIIFEGDARAHIGEAFANACALEETMPPSPVRLETERQRFLRAPLVIGVVSLIKPKPGAPEWEQVLSAGAVCFNICLAANALGYATNWITEWIAYSPAVQAVLQLKDGERIAGFIYVGRASEAPEERERPVIADLVTRWPA